VRFWLSFSLPEHQGASLGLQSKKQQNTSTKTPICVHIGAWGISIYRVLVVFWFFLESYSKKWCTPRLSLLK
jgi:hypothetical protein